jgi:Ca2+-binding RTX toxin-like protein
VAPPEPEPEPEPEPVNQLVYDGSPTLVGTDGDDRLVYLGFTPKNFTLMTQTEVIDSGLGDDYIEAGFFLNDNDFASTSGLIINGGDGDDTLSSNGIGSEFNSGDGNDLIDVAVNDTVNGGSGNDTISSTGGAVVDGGTGDDALIGQYNDTQFGGAGNNVLSGASSMSGGDGNDTISGFYELSGGDGDDLLTSSANPYAAGDGDAIGMSGDAGNDTLTASADIGYGNTPFVPGSTLVRSGGDGADLFDDNRVAECRRDYR